MRIVEAGTPSAVAAGLALRTEVFVGEQGVSPDAEHDALDDSPSTLHLLVVAGWFDEDHARAENVLAVGRLLAPQEDGRPHVGRVAVAKWARRKGLGSMIMEALEAAALDRYGREGAVTVALSAQEQAIPFYEAIGYVIHGDRYLDEGIWHRDAVKTILAPGGA